jgi:hypothetical protein
MSAYVAKTAPTNRDSAGGAIHRAPTTPSPRTNAKGRDTSRPYVDEPQERPAGSVHRAAARSLRRAHTVTEDVTSARTNVATVGAKGRYLAVALTIGVRRARRHANVAAAIAAARRVRRARARHSRAAAFAGSSAASGFSAFSAASATWLIAELSRISFGARGEAKSTEPNC